MGDENPDVMSVSGTDNDWVRNDELLRVEYADGTTRPYTEAEWLAAGRREVAAAEQVTADALEVENDALRQGLKAVVTELNLLVDKIDLTLAVGNPVINAAPAAYIKDGLRAVKQTLLSVRDLIKVIR